MLEQIKIKNILFLDIETVPVKENFEDLAPTFQELWEDKTAWQRKNEFTPSEFYKMKAGVMAEFAKIICISVGYLFFEKRASHFRIKSFYGDDERKIISDFNALLISKFNKTQHQLCAHNGKEFDFPFGIKVFVESTVFGIILRIKIGSSEKCSQKVFSE